MVSHVNPPNELYNLRWNSYVSNLILNFTDHQKQESLVDVTIGCEGQFLKAHKLVLSACSTYFQKIFQVHTTPQLLILLNDVKFEHLRLVIQFMYKGEVKVADSEMPQFLQVGKMLQVKGLCSVELHEKQKQQIEDTNHKEPEIAPEKSTTEKVKPSESRKLASPAKVVENDKLERVTESPALKKRKIDTTKIVTIDNKKTNSRSQSPLDATHIPRPPNAFMIFANQWRRKLAVEYPNESNKDISIRLGNMWKSLSPETKDQFYEDAKKAEEEHKIKYPGYFYSPKEARHRKAIANITREAQRTDNSTEDINTFTEPEFIEIKCEDDLDEGTDVNSN